MSQLSDSARRETEVRTIVGLLREHMEDFDFEGGRRPISLKERFGFKGGFGCCGGTWGFRSTISVSDDLETANAAAARNPSPAAGMNLAAALAAERQLREEVSLRSPVRVSLMRLLEETEKETEAGGGDEVKERGSDTVCCVCMVRKKGAALIPCGHTYCRVCSREVWLNRGTCPLCKRPILQILDLF